MRTGPGAAASRNGSRRAIRARGELDAQTRPPSARLVLVYAGTLLLSPQARLLGLLFPAGSFAILMLFTVLDAVFASSGIKLLVARTAFCVAIHAPAFLWAVFIGKGP